MPSMSSVEVHPIFTDSSKCDFNVWAPKAKTVSLVDISGKREIEMKNENGDYWKLELADCWEGMLYKYRINNSEPIPDPASMSQPMGVHGPSEILRIKDFEWMDQSWESIPLKDFIIYEIHTGTFSPSSDFEGIIKKLDYLSELGVNAIELMPVSQFSGSRNWGYDGVYPYAVHDSYGGAFGLMKLVNECHKKGIALILDVVYNHLGPEGNYLGQFGHYFSDKYKTPWGKAINFDGPYSDDVRNYFLRNAMMWFLDFHIDALRLDAVDQIYDSGAKHFLSELSDNISKVDGISGRKHYLIAESHNNDIRYLAFPEQGGYSLDALWSDDFHHSIHAFSTGEKKGYYMDYGSSSHLITSMKETFFYKGKYSKFRKKTFGSDASDIQGERFVIFNQNHDQAGNRKQGERLISLTGFEAAKVIAATMLLTPNLPMLFMGEEYGEKNPFYYFVSHLDPDLNQKIRKGRKQEMIDFRNDRSEEADPSDPNTFEESVLSWGIEKSEQKRAMFNYYKQLIRIRKYHPVMASTDKKNMKITETGKAILVERWKANVKLLGILNFESEGGYLSIPSDLQGELYKLIDSTASSFMGQGDAYPAKISACDQIALPGKSFTLYSNKTI